jgi:hypothetical protein
MRQIYSGSKRKLSQSPDKNHGSSMACFLLSASFLLIKINPFSEKKAFYRMRN